MKGFSPIGRVGKPFGLDGEVAVNFYDAFDWETDNKEPLYVIIDMLAVPLFIDSIKKKGRNGAIIRFADIDSQMRADELIGLEIYRKKDPAESEKRDEEELFFEDLIGYTAYTSETGKEVQVAGKIIGFIDNEMNPLLVVALEDNEIYIPANNDFIDYVDVENNTIEFSLPEGFLDLYI